MSTQTNSVKPVRTATDARAERTCRAAQKSAQGRAVSDRDADALLPTYDPTDAYPALSSRNLDRREARDAYRAANEDYGSSRVTSGEFFTNCANPSDANFNRMAPASHLSRAAASDMIAREIDRILSALHLEDAVREIVDLRLSGLSLQEVADRFGTNKQTIARRLDGVGKKLAIFLNEDQSCGLDAVFQSMTLRSIHHGLTTGRAAAEANVCDCGSWSNRAQRVKGKEGEYTFHCQHCKQKRTASEFKALIQGQGPAGALRGS